ncbi:hypothetical protein [Chryseobacterium oryctis]|uniref:Uncharacterized protein n=1 Tax=Chryseobacterium oryctis TaxID=2952618 RepID=A0ABT3HQS0_9FLAO|nr:hypothetical protein [Chryseobacterium oryctis]MCW3162126.1 hypothetical protein [Chryseobacterium oryctis]
MKDFRVEYITKRKERKEEILEIKKDFGNSLCTRLCKGDFGKSEEFRKHSKQKNSDTCIYQSFLIVVK